MFAVRQSASAEILAVEGPNTVVVATTDGNAVWSDGNVVLRDLELRTTADEHNAIRVSGGSLTMHDCTATSKFSAAIYSSDGARLYLYGTEIRYGAVVMSASTGVFRNCRIVNSKYNGIKLVNRSIAEISNSRMHDCGNNGVYVTGTSQVTINRSEFARCMNGITFEEGSRGDLRDSTFHGIGRRAIHFFTQSDGLVERCSVSQAQVAIEVSSGSSPTFRMCQITDSLHSGVWINGHGRALFDDCKVLRSAEIGLAVSGNAIVKLDDCQIDDGSVGVSVFEQGLALLANLKISNIDGAGIDVGEGSRVELTAAHLAGCGVEISGEGASGFLRNVTVVEASENGVNISKAARLEMHDCTINSSQRDGISIEQGCSASLSNCTVQDNQGLGLRGADNRRVRIAGLTDYGNHGSELASEQSTGESAAADMVSPTERDGHGRGRVNEHPPSTVVDDAAGLDGLLVELDGLVGLAGVKEKLQSLVGLSTVAKMRRNAGISAQSVFSSHLVFAGPAGTGKTTVARLYGRILASVGLLANGQFIEASRSDLVGQYLGHTTEKTTKLFNRARGGVLFIDEAYSLSRQFGISGDFGQEAIDLLVKLMEDHRDDTVVIVAGPSSEMRQFLDANPGLRSRFSRVIEFESYQPEQLAEIFVRMASRSGFEFTEDTKARALQFLCESTPGRIHGNARYARELLGLVIERHARRVSNLNRDPTRQELVLLLPEDFDSTEVQQLSIRMGGINSDQAQVSKLLTELLGMTGLAEAKRHVTELIDLIDNARRRRSVGLAVSSGSHNLLFVGPSGTGKTTVARLYGNLLAALGVLAQGNVSEVSRRDLVGKHVGETALKTAEVFDRARGGVLFIDEAYSLFRRDNPGQDFGRESIDTLAKLMEDHRDEVVVIAAGYPAEMRDLLTANPGLASRFSRTIRFDPYTPSELVGITANFAAGDDYDVPQATREALSTYFEDLSKRGHEEAGNARAARTLFERMVSKQATRVEGVTVPGVLRTLTPDDLAAALL